MTHEIKLGNCLEVLKQYPDNYFTSIITDPPYGLSFMGKKWDYDVPSIEMWKECLRVLKHGGTLLCFAGSRTQHRMAINIEDAGFYIKDCLMWLYAQGFPKATDIGKNVPEFKGYKSHALKPAYEPIIMAMKPNDGSYAENAIKWGVSGINIEDSRIGTDNLDTYDLEKRCLSKGSTKETNINFTGRYKDLKHGVTTQGRFPANILLDEEAANMLGTPSRFFYCAKASSKERNEGLDDIPFKECGIKNDSGRGFSESDPYKTIQYKNVHSTVKPLKLMEYLIKLIIPPKDGLLLDPFAGSGTTILAAKNLGYNAIGIEMCAEYVEIAIKRVG